MRRLMLWFSLHPVLTLMLIGTISVAAISPASRVRIATSIDSLMMQNDPERDYYVQTRNLFGSEAMAIVYVEDPELFSPGKLAALEELVFDLKGVYGIESVESLFTVTDISNTAEHLNVQPLIDWIPETVEEASTLWERTRAHPVLRRLLVSDEGDATIINLRLDMHNGHAEEMRTLSTSIENALAPYVEKFQTVEQLGRPYVIDQEAAYILRDQRVLLPMATGVLVVMLLLILASFKGAVLPLLTSGVSILWTFAFMGLFDFPITELSFMVPSLIIVIGSTEDIHLLAEYNAGRKSGMERQPAVKRMVMRLAVAVVFTALTTFSGFVSITASPMPVLRDFGMVASFGLLVNPLVTISLIPACLALFPDQTNKSRRRHKTSRFERRLLEGLTKARRRPKITLAAVCIPCIAAGIYGAVNVKADNNIIGFFKPDSPIVLRADRLHEKLSGAETFCIRIDAPDPGAFKTPENLGYALQLQQYLNEEGWIDRSISLTDYLAHVHRTFTGSSTPLPDSARGVAEYLLLLHRTEIEPYVTPDFTSLNIVVRHNIRSSRKLIPRITELREHIEQTCPPGLTVGVTGEMLLVNKAVDALVRGQLRGILIIALVAAVLLSLLFRSVRIGCIGLIPNLIPIGIQFGVMAWAGIPLNTATSMAAAIGIGLAVDDTIHLLMRFYSQDPGLEPEQAVNRSVRHLLRPVVATSLSLSLGFLVMRFSQFTPISDFGLLAAIVLLTALVADLLVTPTLLSLKIMHPPSRCSRTQNVSEEFS